MALPQEASDVFIVHRGPQIHKVYVDLNDAFKELQKLIRGGQEFTITQGFEAYGRVCNHYGLEGRSQLSMVEARKASEVLEEQVTAWKKGRVS